ncbi:hypothetical protein [Acidisoma sp. S159]|uniref:hypothetical protein n=1 Tax=Acidisoma sp. S159 TaxID=1747225 RepID=UPI00131B5FF9|nr:hypothetical protein [Acidisoma sp. S159]
MDGKLQRRGVGVFVVSFGSVFIIALLSLFVTDRFKRPVIEDIYHSVGLFTGNSSWAFDKSASPTPPQIFKVLAIVAPIVSLFGLAELFTGRAWSDLLRLWSVLLVRLGRKRPTAIFGLTSESLAFARSLRTPDRLELPVIFDPEPSLTLLNQCEHDGIPVFTLLPKQKDYFWPRLSWVGLGLGLGFNALPAFLLVRAKYHISFFSDADDQVRFVKALDRWLSERDVSPMDIWLLMPQRGLRQRLDSYLKFYAERLRLRFFDFYGLAARQLLHKHPLDVWADALGHEQIHLAIYGFGNLGRAIAKEAARYYVTRAAFSGLKLRLRVSVIDRAPDAAMAAFLAEEPEIQQLLDIKPIEATLQISGFTAEQVQSVVPDHVTAHIITLDEPSWVIAQALSLRRWMLEPPPAADAKWMADHRNAPIFVTVADRGGLGGLVRSGNDRTLRPVGNSEAPDAIFGFGNVDELLHHTAIVGTDRDAGAAVLHKHYTEHVGPGEADRPAAVPWSDLAPNLRYSNMLAFDHLQVKARALGYRIVTPLEQNAFSTRTGDVGGHIVEFPKPDAPPPLAFDEAEKEILSKLEHMRYVAERVSEGWRRGDIRCDAMRVHPDLRDWTQLGDTERKIDDALIVAIPAALAKVKRRLVRAHFVGITGHRLPDARSKAPPRMDEGWVRQNLREKLSKILGEHAGAVLLTALATGADTWAVDEALKLDMPYNVVLPLPYELYREDFGPEAEGYAHPSQATNSWDNTFCSLVARAEYYLEMPLQHRCSEMSRPRSGDIAPAARVRRAVQYALAGRYIVERSHTLLAVSDREASRGIGGTADLIAMRETLAAGSAKPEMRLRFFAAPPMTRPVIIPAWPPRVRS